MNIHFSAAKAERIEKGPREGAYTISVGPLAGSNKGQLKWHTEPMHSGKFRSLAKLETDMRKMDKKDVTEPEAKQWLTRAKTNLIAALKKTDATFSEQKTALLDMLQSPSLRGNCRKGFNGTYSLELSTNMEGLPGKTFSI